MQNMISYDTHAGRPIHFGNRRIVPFSKRLQFRLSGLWGFILWERPVSILVSEEDSREDILQILDITRYIILGLFGWTILFWLVTRKFRR